MEVSGTGGGMRSNNSVDEMVFGLNHILPSALSQIKAYIKHALFNILSTSYMVV